VLFKIKIIIPVYNNCRIMQLEKFNYKDFAYAEWFDSKIVFTHNVTKLNSVTIPILINIQKIIQNEGRY